MQKFYAQFRSAFWKNSKFTYFLLNYLRLIIPRKLCQLRLEYELKKVSDFDREYLQKRLDYYLKIDQKFALKKGEKLSDFKYRARCKNYFFDIYQYSRYFPDTHTMNYILGDVTEIPEELSFVKSRPIHGENENSVLLKLNKVRHFVFVNDKRDFEDKEFKLLWRGKANPRKKTRMNFIEEYHNHPLCDIGHINDNLVDFDYELKEKLPIYEHLKYQFVMSLEGNDVATNLKWVMSSNSIAVMPRPKYETWFMEGTLIPDYHYIEVKDDFSDLIEKITFYHNNPVASKEIIRNANKHVEQFKNKKREKLLSLLVMDKYFKLQK
ncbi:glycosyl transferase family 90 [Balneicella halophila]|nr:glycosyl transferase family 90 [Balneicella halophila]